MTATAAGTSNVTFNGNVGIGTTAPAYKLNVSAEGSTGAQGMLSLDYSYTSSARPIMRFQKSRGTLAVPLNVQDGDNLSSITSNSYFNGTYSSVTSIEAATDGTQTSTSLPSRITFATTGSGEVARAERMRISGNGNVGIGTSNPAVALEVSNGQSASNLKLSRSDGDSRYLAFRPPNGSAGGAQVSVSGTPIVELQSSGMVIGSGWTSGTNAAPSNGLIVQGNVGIGTTSPSEKLHVSGNILASGTITGSSDKRKEKYSTN